MIAAVALALIGRVTSVKSGAPATEARATSNPTSWKRAGNAMADERWAPAFCLLPDNGRAMIAGGYSYSKRECVASISLFDSRSNRFNPSHARLPYPADFVLAAPLPDGTVLLAGGFNDVWGSLDAAAIYHPKQDVCLLLPQRMEARRELAQATPLAGGRVLITGGLDLGTAGTLASAELYDPARELFEAAAPMLEDRFGHAACRLADGRVLVVGGTHWNIRSRDSQVLAEAEIYDPVRNAFHRCSGVLMDARDRPTATLLPDGMVLVAGGQGMGGKPLDSAELFDPATEQFTRIASAPLTPRMAHAAVALLSGDVLLCGGWDADTRSTTSTCVVYDWHSQTFTAAPDLPFAVHDLALVGFPNGTILAAGGKLARDTRSAANDAGAALIGPR